MSLPRSIDLTPAEAAALIDGELRAANESLRSAQTDAALDRFVTTLGLALQLGPTPVDTVLLWLMQALRESTLHIDSETLSTLGPALVHVVSQVREAGALPPSRIMVAWATVASDVGTILGQVGLALSIEASFRIGMMANARIRAAALDEATGSRYAIADWIDHLPASS